MKMTAYSARQVGEALRKVLDDNSEFGTPSETDYELAKYFLDYLPQTKPGESENVVIETVEPE